MDADVLVVGYGPIGQVLSNLLAHRGWRVTVVEKFPQPYTMPRAVSFDSEAARILAAAGVGDHLAEFGECSSEYSWQTATGETLLYSEVSPVGWCGHPDSTSMYQPGLEAALAAHGETLPTLTVHRGQRAVELTEGEDRVTLVAEDSAGSRLTLTARFVVGCDGANSFVRERIGAQTIDLGFAHDWLVCDVEPNEPREFKPNNLQICDPARPRTSVSAGPGHRRWEFMRVPGETVEELCTEESAWQLLKLFDISPDNARLERFAVYTFQASYANRWRAGRMLIAGDAAHLMPPFAGQGMSSGFRDAINLAWKLDLVLRGQAEERLLDTYTVERKAHVQHAINLSVNLGRVICQVDPEVAADHHAVLIAARQRGLATNRARSTIQPLDDGFLHQEPGKAPVRPVGALMPQGRVARGDRVGFFDEVVGQGFALIATEDPRGLLDEATRSFLEGIGTRLVHMLPSGAGSDRAGEVAAVDVDDVYLPFLTEANVSAVLVRPDFYVYGAAADGKQLTDLVAGLRDRLAPVG